jgi:hypothetical protein
MTPLTIEEFAAEGYTHIECVCPRCRAVGVVATAIQIGEELDSLDRPAMTMLETSRAASRKVH